MPIESRPRPPRIQMRAFSRTEKVIAFCRVLLAAATALIVIADPKLPAGLPGVTLAVLAGYLLFSLLLFWLVRSERLSQQTVGPASVAADVGWITLLTLLTERGASPFFLLHVFVISSASVRWGFSTTVRLALFLALLYPLTAFTASRFIDPSVFTFQRPHIFRPLYLVVIGYLIGYLGENEHQAKRKLGLMLELMTTVRRHRPSGRLLGLLMRRVLAFFGTEHALVSVRDPESGRYFTWRLVRSPDRRRLGLTITADLPCHLPFARDTEGVLSNDPTPGRGSALCYDVLTGTLERRPISTATRLPVAGAKAFMASPILLPQGARGLVVLASTGARRFTREDLEYLLLLVAQGAVGLEAGRLQHAAEEVAVLEERARIARDLHDGFIQSLAAIDLRLETTKRLLTRRPEGVSAALDELHRAVERSYRDVRQYLKVLRATTRPVEGLASALERVVADVRLRHRVAIDLRRPPSDPDLAVATVHELTQIVREALNNAVRHGQARHITVEVTVQDTHLRAVVRDDGRGFDDGADAAGRLNAERIPWSIRERAHILDADVSIRTGPGAGATVTLSIPLVRAPRASTG